MMAILSQQPTTPGFRLGTAQSSQPFQFNIPQPGSASNFNFGQIANTQPFGFGTQNQLFKFGGTPTPSSSLFGANTQSFGATKPLQSMFGQAVTQQTSAFGQQTPHQPFSFGQQQPSQPFSFGQQPKPLQQSMFGQAVTQQTSAFGQQTPQQPFSFGQQQPSAFGQQVQQPFSFGQQQPSTFGQQVQQPSAFGQQVQQPFSFGQQHPSAFGQQVQQPSSFGQQQPSSFGQQVQQPSAFGQQTPQQPFSFGQQQPSAFGQQFQQPFAFGQQHPSSFGQQFQQQPFGQQVQQQPFGGFGQQVQQQPFVQQFPQQPLNYSQQSAWGQPPYPYSVQPIVQWQQPTNWSEIANFPNALVQTSLHGSPSIFSSNPLFQSPLFNWKENRYSGRLYATGLSDLSSILLQPPGAAVQANGRLPRNSVLADSLRDDALRIDWMKEMKNNWSQAKQERHMNPKQHMPFRPYNSDADDLKDRNSYLNQYPFKSDSGVQSCKRFDHSRANFLEKSNVRHYHPKFGTPGRRIGERPKPYTQHPCNLSFYPSLNSRLARREPKNEYNFFEATPFGLFEHPTVLNESHRR